MSSLDVVLGTFQSIGLDEIQEAALMNRVDTKYVFSVCKLNSLLKNVSDEYFILTISGENKFNYLTSYLDTKDDKFYLAHHNGLFNRFKIRYRTYVDVDKTFLEIKEKVKGQRTNKFRMLYEDEAQMVDDYILQNTDLKNVELKEKLSTEFDRITLVGKNFDQRITIDTNLNFKNSRDAQLLNSVVILEVKKSKAIGLTPIELELKSQGIRKMGFSKYCFGRACLDDNLKHNNFNKYFRLVEKIENTSYMS